MLWVGLIHGLAGTTGVVALIPVALMPDWRVGVGYLLIFCLGVTAGMITFASLLARTIERATNRSLIWGRRVAASVALASVATGVIWLWPKP